MYLCFLQSGYVKVFKAFLIFLNLMSFSGSDSKAEGTEEADKKEEPTEGGEGAKVDDSVFRPYMTVGNMVVPIVKREGVYAYVKLTIQIITKDGTSIEPYRPYKNRLYDAYFTDVYTILSDRWLPPKEPSKDSVQKRLSKRTDQIVGPDKLTTIITTFYFYKPEKKA